MLRMRINCFTWILFIVIAFLFHAATSNALEQISSPNGQIVVYCNLHINAPPYPPGERFYFNIQFQGVPIIKDSPLGISFAGEDPLAGDLRIYHVKRESGTESYSLVHGKQKHIHQPFNEATFSMQERAPPFRILKIIFRVTDEGVAFRYMIPAQSELNTFLITGEQTSFYLADDFECYGAILPNFQTGYESKITVSSINSLHHADLIGCPFLLHPKEGPWIAITEANLTNYAGMYLSPVGGHTALRCVLSPSLKDASQKVHGHTPFTTPWRVLLIGEKPGDLIESNLITSLNDTCAFNDVSWIKPGKCVGPGWTNFWVGGSTNQGGMDTGTILHYLDFAAEENLEYLLVPAGWYGDETDPYADIATSVSSLDLEKVLSQSEEKGVGVILWLNWKCLQNQMDRVLPLYQEWGISGILIDGMNRDDQEMVAFYHNVLRETEQYKLLVNFHGAYKPTGIRRTYPHLITREAVLGSEYNKRSDQCNPEHEMLLPFTRMLAGPMDFTPGCFRTISQEGFTSEVVPPAAMGTRCRQLAMYVVFESPLQMCVDFPGAYRDQAGFEFLKSVPTTWDTTVVIDAKVGDYIAVARQKDDVWHIGCMTDWTAREIPVPLDFLGEGIYEAEIFSEAANVQFKPMEIRIRKIRVRSDDILYSAMGPGGGYAARLTPLKED